MFIDLLTDNLTKKNGFLYWNAKAAEIFLAIHKLALAHEITPKQWKKVQLFAQTVHDED